MKILLIWAAVICMAIAAPQASEDEVAKGQACLAQRALEQKNKEIVEAVVLEVFNNHDFTNAGKYIHEDFIDHNPNVENGIEAFRVFATEWTNRTEAGKTTIFRLSAEGDLVWNHLRTPSPDQGDVVIMEAFKLKDGKLVEHWDVIQPIGDLSKSKNPHPFF